MGVIETDPLTRLSRTNKNTAKALKTAILKFTEKLFNECFAKQCTLIVNDFALWDFKCRTEYRINSMSNDNDILKQQIPKQGFWFRWDVWANGSDL